MPTLMLNHTTMSCLPLNTIDQACVSQGESERAGNTEEELAPISNSGFADLIGSLLLKSYLLVSFLNQFFLLSSWVFEGLVK